jgi:PKD repeat protein
MIINTSYSIGNLNIASANATASLVTNPLNVINHININSGTLRPNNLDITLGGNWFNSGTFIPGNATVTFSSAAAQSILRTGGETYNNLTFTGSGVKTFSSAVTASIVTINSGSSVDVSAANNQLTLRSNFINNGTFNARSGLVFLNGTTSQSIGGSSTTNFFDLTLNNSAGALLTSAENLIGTLNLNNGIFNTNSQVFTMVSTATNTARIAQITGSGNISGNVTVQRFAPSGFTGWTLLGTPITSALTYADWDDDIFISCPTCPDGSASGFLSIYSYDETAGGAYDDPSAYIPLSGITDPITPNTGYWVYLGTGSVSTTNITLDVTGTVGKFNTPIPLKYTNTGTPANDGWNLITNPFPSPVRWSLLKGASANLDNAIYAYNPDLNAGAGAHATYVNNISSPAVSAGGIGDTIPMAQGFYVHVTGTSTITAQETNKVGGNPNFLKIIPNNNTTASSIPLLRLHLLSAMGHDDETVLYMQSGASDNFDNDYDAYKMRGQDPFAPILALEKSNDLFQINGVAPIVGNFSMPLKALTGYSGTYTISPENISSFPAGACITLFDLFTNTTTNLKTNSYVFTLADTTSVPRFRLNITLNPLTINSNINNPTCTSPSSGAITAIGTNSGPWNYFWKNSVGTTIQASLNKTTADTLKNLAGSTYSVEVNTVGTCDNNTTGFTINSVVLPTSQFACEDTTYLSLGALITCTNTSSNVNNYFWDFGDGFGFSTASNPTYNYSAAGIYTVTLIGTSTTGCNDTITQVVVVTNAISTGISSINNSNSMLIKTLRTNEYLLEKNLDTEMKCSFKLLDAFGRLIADYGSITTRKISLPLDLRSYASGIYYLRLNVGDEAQVIKLPVQ